MLSDSDLISNCVKVASSDTRCTRENNRLVKRKTRFLEELLDLFDGPQSAFRSHKRWHRDINCAWNVACVVSGSKSCVNDLRLHLTRSYGLNVFKSGNEFRSEMDIEVSSGSLVRLAALGGSVAPVLEATVEDLDVFETPGFQNVGGSGGKLVVSPVVANHWLVKTDTNICEVCSNLFFLGHHVWIGAFSVFKVGQAKVDGTGDVLFSEGFALVAESGRIGRAVKDCYVLVNFEEFVG